MNRAVLLFIVIAYAVSWTIAEAYYRLIGATPTGTVIMAAAFMHGTLNATAGVLVFLSGGNDLLKGPAGLAGMLVLLAANAWLWVARRRTAKHAAAGYAPGP
jgi:hypothetical protein